jgi:hypothetical protein
MDQVAPSRLHLPEPPIDSLGLRRDVTAGKRVPHAAHRLHHVAPEGHLRELRLVDRPVGNQVADGATQLVGVDGIDQRLRFRAGEDNAARP